MTNTTILRGWVEQSDGRGSFDIIWSSFLTIFLCTWTCIHLNVPAPNEGTWRPILRKLRWMIFTLFAPEFVLALAAGQRANARRTTDTMQSMGHLDWTIRHSFYANMGGFILQPTNSKPFPIHGIHLVWLVKEGYLAVPEITEEEIFDKSKANLLNKLLCLARWRQNLSLTTIELATITFVWCTWGIYSQWLNKPVDVESPTVLKIKASTEEILLKAGPAASKPYRETPLDFVWDWHVSWTLDVQPYLPFRIGPRKRPIPRILNDSMPWYDRGSDVALMIAMILVYGAIHMLGWHFIFPTKIEKILWRVSALAILCTTSAFNLWLVIWGTFRSCYLLHLNKQPIRPMSVYYVFSGQHHKVRGANGLPVHNAKFDKEVITVYEIVFIAPFGLLYVLSRLYVMSEALGSLRALPAEAFQDVDWTKVIPHF